MTSAEPPTGLLLVDKPAAVTSHDVVGRVRAIAGTRRVGHAGTLDPMATGLLIVAVGRATRLLGHLALADKSYTATIRLGEATATDDADGEIVSRADASSVTDEAIAAGMTRLIGHIEQVPSSYSAIKVAGRRAYDLARGGAEVTLAARPVTVSRFDLLGPPHRSGGTVDLDVIVDCGTGTYVRALARDLGAMLGVGGHLTALRRQRIGPLPIVEAIDVFPDGVTPRGEARPPIGADLRERVSRAVIPVSDAARRVFAHRIVDDDEAADLRHGRPLPAARIDGVYAVFDRAGQLLALVREDDARARPVFVWQAA
jgi:tRNA pseudouridine55 synthase